MYELKFPILYQLATSFVGIIFSQTNTYILATTCGHYFHSECMEEHMNDSINEKRCPLDNIQIHYSTLK